MDDGIREFFIMTNNSIPILTICIPTFERAVMLDKCLAALYDIETHNHNFCLIVADNASTDNTKDVIAQWKRKLHNMETICQETNVGYDRNVYSLYSAVKTDYCWLLGDSDSVSLQHFARIEENLTKGYDALIINNDTSIEKHTKEYTDLDAFLNEQCWHITKLSSIIIRREALVPEVVRHYFDSAFVHVGALVDYLCWKEKWHVFFDSDIHILYLDDETGLREKQSGGWRKMPFSIWGKCWSQLILSFPYKIPYELKLKIMKDHERQYHWFSNKVLRNNKIIYGSSYIEDYKKNRKYVHMVTVASPFWSDFVMYMPIEPVFKVWHFVKKVCRRMFK